MVLADIHYEVTHDDPQRAYLAVEDTSTCALPGSSLLRVLEKQQVLAQTFPERGESRGRLQSEAPYRAKRNPEIPVSNPVVVPCGPEAKAAHRICCRGTHAMIHKINN